MAENASWEYRVETFGSALSSIKDDDLEQTLDEWGLEGWEVISAHPLSSSSKLRVIARRLLTTSTRRRRSWPS